MMCRLMQRLLGARDMGRSRISLLVLFAIALTAHGQVPAVYPGREWAAKQPAEIGLSAEKLRAFSDYVGGFGCVVRHGYMIYAWGDASQRMDVASAAKPVYAHLLFKAVEDKRIADLDELVCIWEPRLKGINESLGYKDARITWRHMANQISCYGVQEEPGTAFDYNDWQMALLWDTLFAKVYGSHVRECRCAGPAPAADRPDRLRGQSHVHGLRRQDRPGRLAHLAARLRALRPAVPARRQLEGQAAHQPGACAGDDEPRAELDPPQRALPAEMIPGQRSMGSQVIPDNQSDHMGSYSWLWWTNGVDREGKRHWPDAPLDTYGCFGHGGKRAMVVIPSLDVVVSWNDADVNGREMENAALGLLLEAVADTPSMVGQRSRPDQVDPEHPHGLDTSFRRRHRSCVLHVRARRS